MKKKSIVIIAFAILVVAVMLSFAFCDRNEELPEPTVVTTAPTTAPTTEPPAPTEPEWEPGIARATHTEAVYSLLNIGTEVEVVGKYEHYFVISGEEYDLLVDEYYVRLATEDAFETWDGYARPKANVFASVYRREEPIAQLTTNTKVKVLEGKGDWLFIEWADGEGYVKASDISKTRLTTGGGGGGGSAPADGTDVNVNLLSATRNQGAVVSLGTYHGPEMEPDFEKCTGIVLAEGIETFICLFDHSGEMKVLEYDEEYCTIYLEEGLTPKVRRQLVMLEGDETEEPWIGYARSKAAVYEEYQRRDEVFTLDLNTEVEVLYQLPGFAYDDEGVYVVCIEEEIYYMNISDISKDRIVPAAGGNGGGNSDSVWTPPAL